MANTAVTKRESQTPSRNGAGPQNPVYSPRVDIRESETEVLIVADMPGVDETSISIDLEGSRLTLRGGFVPKAPEGYTMTYQEYDNGDYERQFTLGDTIDREGIKAVVKDGVLRLVLPKVREIQPKRITVKVG